MWRPIISQICFQLSTWPMKLARVSGERQLQRWSDTDTEHASPAHSSSTQSIRQLSASAGISLDEHCCCEHFLPTVESLPAVAQWNLQSRRRAFPQHKRLWRIARRICSIYAAISLHSSQRQRLHQTKAAQISQCHPNSWHQMAMISLPWLLKHQTFPVKTSSVPMCSNFPSAKRQCPSCSVKLHLNIYIVCNLSNLSQWNISKRYTYYIYILHWAGSDEHWIGFDIQWEDKRQTVKPNGSLQPQRHPKSFLNIGQLIWNEHSPPPATFGYVGTNAFIQWLCTLTIYMMCIGLQQIIFFNWWFQPLWKMCQLGSLFPIYG